MQIRKQITFVVIYIFIFSSVSMVFVQTTLADNEDFGPDFLKVWRNPQQPTEKTNVVVFAEIDDTDGISSVKLLYEVSNGETIVVHMQYKYEYLFSIGLVYVGYINSYPEGNLVSYNIEAIDASEEHLTSTSLQYYYRIAKDGEPAIILQSNLPKFLIEGSTEELTIDFVVEDEDIVDEESVLLYYSINDEQVYSNVANYGGGNNYTVILPHPVSLNLNKSDEVKFWIEATDQYNQTGLTREHSCLCLGNEPYVNNVFLSPSVPSSSDNFTINAEIFYKENLVINQVTAYYSINTISSQTNLLESSSMDFRFTSETIPKLGCRGIFTFYLDIVFDTNNLTQSSNYQFSILDSSPPSLVDGHVVFTNPEDIIKEYELAEVEAYVYDNVRTYHSIAWFLDEYGTHGVELLRDNKEFFTWRGDYGDDGISFLEDIIFDETITSEIELDGVICHPSYITDVSWNNQQSGYNSCEFIFKQNLDKVYLGVNLQNFININYYNQLAISWKGTSTNILLSGIKDSLISQNYIWNPISEGTSHTGDLLLSDVEFNLLQLYNFEQGFENTKRVWLEFIPYETTYFENNDGIIIDRIRLQNVDQFGDLGEDRDYAVYSGSYAPVGPNTDIEFYLSIVDFSQTTYTSVSSRKLSVVDGKAPIISLSGIMGIDYLDPFIPIGCLIEDSSELNEISLYYKKNDEGYQNVSMNEVAENEYYFEISNLNSEFEYSDILSYYIKAVDVHGNEAISEIKTVTISEIVLPTVNMIALDEARNPVSTVDYEDNVILSAEIYDIDSGIQSIEFQWTNPRNVSGHYIYQNSEGLLVQPGNQFSTYDVLVNYLGFSGYLYWYVVVIDGEGNRLQSNLLNVIISDQHSPEISSEPLKILNSLGFIGSNEDAQIQVSVIDVSMIQEISLTATEFVNGQPVFTHPSNIYWDGYEHEGDVYTYEFIISNPNSVDYWNPYSELKFNLLVVDVYGNIAELNYFSNTIIQDKNKPVLLNSQYLYEETELDRFVYCFDFADETNIQGEIYYGIENGLTLSNISAWNVIEFELSTIDRVYNPENNKYIFHFEEEIIFENALDWMDFITYYIFVNDSWGNERLYYNNQVLDANSLANDYAAYTKKIAFIDNFRKKTVLEIDNFHEYPNDNSCLILTEVSEGYGVDGSNTEFFDLEYSPYDYVNEEYAPSVSRHTAAIYSYDFYESNTKVMKSLNQETPLNSFQFSPTDYYKDHEIEEYNIQQLEASNGYLIINQDAHPFIYAEHMAYLYIPLSFCKMLPFFKISFTEISGCQVKILAKNYWSWEDRWVPTYYQDPRGFDTVLLNNLTESGDYYSSLIRPEEFWGIEIQIFSPDMVSPLEEFSVIIDYIKLFQIRHSVGGEDLDQLTYEDYQGYGLGYANLVNFEYGDTPVYVPRYNSDYLLDRILLPVTKIYDASWTGTLSTEFFSLAGVFYVNDMSELSYLDVYENVFRSDYPTKIKAYDIPIFSFNGLSYEKGYNLDYLAQEVKVVTHNETCFSLSYYEHDGYSEMLKYSQSQPIFQHKLNPTILNALIDSSFLLELASNTSISSISWSCLTALLTDDFMHWDSGFAITSVREVYFHVNWNDLTRNIGYSISENDLILLASEGFSTQVQAIIHPALSDYMSDSWNISETIQNINGLEGYGNTISDSSLPSIDEYYHSYVLNSEWIISSSTHQSIATYTPILELGNNIEFNQSIYESTSYCTSNFIKYSFTNPDSYNSGFLSFKLEAPLADKDIVVAIIIDSLGEQWIDKSKIFVTEDYIRVDWEGHRMYLLNSTSRDLEGNQLFSFSYTDKKILASSYYTDICIELGLEEFQQIALPSSVYIQSVKVFDYLDNSYTILNYPQYNLSDFMITETVQEFLIPLNWSGTVFAVKKVEIIISTQASQDTKLWLKVGHVKFVNIEQPPKFKVVKDIFEPILETIFIDNLDYTSSSFNVQGSISDSMSGISLVKIYYKRYFADFVNDLYDIIINPDYLYFYSDSEFILLKEVIVEDFFYTFSEIIPNTNHPLYVTYFEIRIEVWDRALKTNKLTQIIPFFTDDYSAPEYDYQTIFTGSHGYSNQYFDFNIDAIDLLSGVAAVEIWFKFFKDDGSYVTYSEPLYLFSGNDKGGTWRYTHTSDSLIQWITDEYVEYYYNLIDILGNNQTTPVYTINFVDDVDPFVLLGDSDLSLPSKPDANRDFDIVIRAADELNTPISIQVEYSVYDYSQGGIMVYTSVLEYMVYTSDWDLQNSLGEFYGFVFTVDHTICGGYDYNDQIFFSFHIRDNQGNYLLLTDYYCIWIEDTLSPTDATIIFPIGLANDQNYKSNVYVTDNAGGTGIQDVELFFSYDNLTWSSYSMSYLTEINDVYIFTYYIPQNELVAGYELLTYVIATDGSSNVYTSEIFSFHVDDKLPPDITNILVYPAEVGYIDEPTISAVISAYEPLQEVSFEYTINGINTQTLSMDYNLTTGRYECVLPSYSFQTAIDGLIYAYSSGGVVNTYPVNFIIADKTPPNIEILQSCIMVERRAGEIQVQVDDLNPNNLILGESWVEAYHRITDIGSFDLCGYIASGDTYTFILPDTYLEGQVIEVKIIAIDYYFNIKEYYLYFTVYTNIAPSIQSIICPSSVGFDIGFEVEISFAINALIDSESVKFKHTNPAGTWTSFTSMSNLSSNVFRVSVNGSEHYGIYNVECYIEYKDIYGNTNSISFNIDSVDIYAPAIPSFHNPSTYVQIQGNPEDSVDILVSSIDENPATNYYCSSGEYRYKIGDGNWTEWTDLTSFNGIAMKLTLEGFASSYLGEMITYETKLYDNFGYSSPIVSNFILIDDLTGPSIFFNAPQDYGDNSDLVLTATISTTGYSLASSSVKFSYYISDPLSFVFLAVVQEGSTFSVTIPKSHLNYGDTLHCRFIAADSRLIEANGVYNLESVDVSIDETGPVVTLLNVNSGDTIVEYDEVVDFSIWVYDVTGYAQVDIRCKGHYETIWSSWVDLTQSIVDDRIWGGDIPQSYIEWISSDSSSRWYDVEIRTRDTLNNYGYHIYENQFRVDDTQLPLPNTPTCSDSFVYNDETFYIYIDSTDAEESYGSSNMDYIELYYKIQNGDGSWPSTFTYATGSMTQVDSDTWRMERGPYTSYGGRSIKYICKTFDNAGNYAWSNALVVDIHQHDTTPPSVTSYYHSPSQPYAYASATVYAYVSEPDSEVTVQVQWYIQGQSTHTNTMTLISGTQYRHTNVHAGAAYKKTYYRIKATSEGGTTTTSWKYFTAKSGGFLSLESQELLDWSFSSDECCFEADFRLDTFDTVLVHLQDQITQNWNIVPLYRKDTAVFSNNLILNHVEDFQFFVTISNDRYVSYTSITHSIHIGDIFKPQILAVTIPEHVPLTTKVQISASVYDKNLKKVYLEFLQPIGNGQWEVQKDKEMKFADGKFIQSFRAKDSPGYYLRIRAVDDYGNYVFSEIYYLYTTHKESSSVITFILPLTIFFGVGVIIIIRKTGFNFSVFRKKLLNLRGNIK